MLVAEEKSKISPVFSLIDEGFVRNRTANYHLSLQLGNDGLSHCVLDIKQNRYIALENFSFQNVYTPDAVCTKVNEVISGSDVLKNLFRSVHISLTHERSTLVPAALYEKGLEKDYLAFNHTVDNDEDLKAYDLKGIDAKIIFSYKNEVYRTLRTHYPNCSFNHFSSSLLETLSGLVHGNDKKLFVHIQSSHFEIVLFRGKKLIYYNSFRHQSAEDFIYFLIFTCEQLELNTDKTEFNLAGEIDKHAPVYSILYKYVRNIKFVERSDAFRMPTGSMMFLNITISTC